MRSQTKFTPGPWIIDPIRSGDKEIYINQPGDSWERLEATVSRDDCDADMALSNAHLIAASPEMYAALQSMLDSAVELSCECFKLEVIQTAKEALAKARGKSS